MKYDSVLLEKNYGYVAWLYMYINVQMHVCISHT